MKFYKSPNNKLFAYELDGSQDHIIPNDFILISNEEAEALRQQIHIDKFNELSYSEKRSMEYPDFKDYLDAIVKNDQQQLQDYINKCLAVKAKYPKSNQGEE